MHGTGMDVSTLNHFHRVAKAMNNYVAASAYSSYTGRDGFQGNTYHPSFQHYTNLGNRFAGGLHSIGLPNSFVNLGYRVGKAICCDCGPVDCCVCIPLDCCCPCCGTGGNGGVITTQPR
ncbi:unnamed protein product [Adineta ricciae]|uniref:Uncharacterized protein n=1 Tax=Adineta ricciae TaxID=249248 RepID=A0A814YFR2_ADIRI|nr:unnamed protein product [Adineta ricciae]